ncbi:MAG TPA: hypothetical protein VGN95_12880, partial [Pyrinomonadaceae bacterium]|nr:hypothetical protein [Pyrinomonadaceae bacterium]
ASLRDSSGCVRGVDGNLYERLKKAVRGMQHAEVALPGGERIAILAPYAEYFEGESSLNFDQAIVR